MGIIAIIIILHYHQCQWETLQGSSLIKSGLARCCSWSSVIISSTSLSFTGVSQQCKEPSIPLINDSVEMSGWQLEQGCGVMVSPGGSVPRWSLEARKDVYGQATIPLCHSGCIPPGLPCLSSCCSIAINTQALSRVYGLKRNKVGCFATVSNWCLIRSSSPLVLDFISIKQYLSSNDHCIIFYQPLLLSYSLCFVDSLSLSLIAPCRDLWWWPA